jgi:hypothetical protein
MGQTGGLDGGTGPASASGMGGVTAGTAGGDNPGGGGDDGQAGDQGCLVNNGMCSCDWATPACDDGKGLYVGPACPPTFDEMRAVANWPLGGPPMVGATRRHGMYLECDNGWREFTYFQCNELKGFIFDAHGELVTWVDDTQFCVSNVCSTPGDSGTPSASNPSCITCTMTSDPGGEGSSCITQAPNNGPTPSCMVDAAGHWLMPKLCDN